jgi:hypothetical protein
LVHDILAVNSLLLQKEASGPVDTDAAGSDDNNAKGRQGTAVETLPSGTACGETLNNCSGNLDTVDIGAVTSLTSLQQVNPINLSKKNPHSACKGGFDEGFL